MNEQVLKTRDVFTSNYNMESKILGVLIVILAMCVLAYFGNYIISKMTSRFDSGYVVYVVIVGGVAFLLVLLYSAVQEYSNNNKAKEAVNANLINARIIKDMNPIPTKNEETNIIVRGAWYKEIVKIKIALKGEVKAKITPVNLEGEQYIMLMNSISKEFKGGINLKGAVLERTESESKVRLQVSGYNYVFVTETDKNEKIKVESTKTKIQQGTITIH